MKALNDFMDEWLYYPAYLAVNIRSNPRNRLGHFARYAAELATENAAYASFAYGLMGRDAAGLAVIATTTARTLQFLHKHSSL